MNKTLIILLLQVCTCYLSAQSVSYSETDSLKAVELIRLAMRQDGNGILYLARQLREVPYVGKTLEVNCQERLVINLQELDCTTFVENVLALYQCVLEKDDSFERFCHHLQRIRYADGHVDYTSRLHYFSHWIEDNSAKGIVEEQTSVQPPFTARQTINVHYMSTYPEKYPALMNDSSKIMEICKMENRINGKTIRYIPQEAVKNSAMMRQTVKDGDILAIVTNKKGLDISHVGFAVWKKDGLHMIHASSTYHKVIEDSLTMGTYLRKHASQIGLRVVRPRH
ncbi:MAG: N-acetylmuramoyl-L-alanine amidase-like domain-containing protein [Prevotella sp.]